MRNLTRANPKSKDVIWPLVTGKDIERWHAGPSGKYLLYMEHGLDVRQIPAVIEHLRPFRAQLEGRATKQAWYELQQPQSRYARQFKKPKILYQVFQVKPCFAYDPRGMMINNSIYAIALDDLYLLGILNSTPFWSEICRHCSRSRMVTN